MTTNQAADPVRAFREALSPAARNRFEVNQQTAGHIHAAIELGHSPESLAKLVGNGIGRYGRGNANDLMHWRLRRAAGCDDEQEGA